MKRGILRTLALLLICTVCLGLASCGKDGKAESSNAAYSEQSADSGTEKGGNAAKARSVAEFNLSDNSISDLDGEAYSDEPYVQMYGSAVSGSERTISVNNTESGVLFNNILGTGCNFYPTFWNYNTQLGSPNFNFGYASEISAKRYNDIHGPYGRSWFQIDWMMTNEAGDDYGQYDDNWEANPDYKNYYEGKYDFNNENFLSCVRYWKMLDDAGMNVEVSFGWKIATRIQSWFSADPTRAKIGAPRDIKQYAKAAAAMFKYCYYEAGLKNINTITLYNEPAQVEDAKWRNTWDFATIGDKRVYWAAMMKGIYNVFHNQPNSAYISGGKGGDPEGRLKKVQIWGAENSDGMDIIDEKYVTPYLNNYYSDIFDAFTLHGYFNYGSRYNTYIDGSTAGDGYKGLCKIFAKCNRFYKKPMYVTEFYCADRDITSSKQYAWNNTNPDNTGWTNSYSAYFIAASNNGCCLQLDWSFTGGYLPDPLGFDPAGGDSAAWYTPGTEEKVDKVQYKYYLYAMRNNYIPRGASSHTLEWTGDDIRASAFTKDNDFALYVEANEGTGNRTLNVNLEKALGNRELYVYVFDYNITKDANATIPTARNTITADSGFSYEISGEYGVYLFSTVKPLKQVSVFAEDGRAESVTNRLSKGSTLKLKARLTDCTAADTVDWKVSMYANAIEYNNSVPLKQTERKLDSTEQLGTVSQNAAGTEISYTPAENAKVGDVIALRGTVKGTNRFAVAIITIV